MAFLNWFKRTKRIIPVIVIDDLEQSIPLAKALVAGGINCLEVTMRTPQALQAIKAISDVVPNAIVGAGTVTSAEQMRQAADAGAQFIISPGISHDLCQMAQKLKIPYVPGVMTPSEILIGLEYKLSLFKFYPANLAGGIDMLEALSGPFKQIQFCPTGGISDKNAQQYLDLENVSAVGGSWVCPNHLVQAGDWPAIQALAEAV